MRYYYTLGEFMKDLDELKDESILVSQTFMLEFSKLYIGEYKRIREYLKNRNVTIMMEKGTRYGKSQKGKSNSL